MIYFLIGLLIVVVLYSVLKNIIVQFIKLLKHHYVITIILIAGVFFLIGYTKVACAFIILLILRCGIGYMNTRRLIRDLNRSCTHLGYVEMSDIENCLKSAQKRFYAKGERAHTIISRFMDQLNDMARNEMKLRVEAYLNKRPIVEMKKIKSEIDFSDYKQTYTIEQSHLLHMEIAKLIRENIVEYISPQKDTIKLVDFSNNEHADSVEISLGDGDLEGLENALNDQLG